MAIWDYFIRKSAAEAPAPSFCSTEFPKLWESFVTSVTDTAFTGDVTTSPSPAVKDQKHIATVVPAAERLVAIGDLHGDLSKALRAFRLAGLTDDKNRWTGGTSVCVQVGDILDRGDDEIKILYFLERLQQEAAAAGGKLYVLNGNHETMTIMGQHRYSTSGAELEALRWRRWQAVADKLKEQCSECSGSRTAASATSTSSSAPSTAVPSSRHFPPGTPPGVSSGGTARGAVMGPGGDVTKRFFAEHPTVLQVGSSVFVHGGVLPSHVDYGLSRINQETRSWMLGEAGGQNPTFLLGASAIVWARQYSTVDRERCDCDTLGEVLKRIPGAERMVMGHTINPGINSACEGRAIRIDVGMSRGCGDHAVEVLEILHDRQIRRLREGQPAEDITRDGARQPTYAERGASALRGAVAGAAVLG